MNPSVPLALLWLAVPAGPGHAATWGEVFAPDSGRVIFLAADGGLWRAPFDLSVRETLWAPTGGHRLARLRVSPDGRRVAWIARAGDLDTTGLWVDGRGLRVKYFTLQPADFGRLQYEADVPSIEDADAAGARFIRPGSLRRRRSCNTLAWTPDSRAIVFGYDDGIAVAPADSGAAFAVSRALAVKLRLLDPAPCYLIEVVVLRRTEQIPPQVSGRGRGNEFTLLNDGIEENLPGDRLVRIDRPAGTDYLVYPTPERWRVFPASGLDFTRRWAASPGTVWWIEGRQIRAVRAHDPNPTVEWRGSEPAVWIGYAPERRSLVWAAGRALRAKGEEGGLPRTVAETRAPIRSVLETPGSARRVVVAGDSALVWDARDGSLARLPLRGLDPNLLLEGARGELLLASCGAGRRGALARLDLSHGALSRIEVPGAARGLFFLTPAGRHVVWVKPEARPPALLQVYDIAAERWSEVENPGITGWEPLAPR